MRQGEFNLYYNLTNSTVTKEILHSNYLDSKKVIFFDNSYRLNEEVKIAINEILTNQNKQTYEK